MKKIKQSAYLLLFVSLVMIAGLTVSCKDDNNSNSQNNGKVELLSFGPSGVQLGDTISFIGNNLDKVTEIVFSGDSVLQPAFLSQTASLIRVKIPQNVQRGYVTLRSPEGDVTSITEIDFLVPVAITTIYTDLEGGYVRPGGTITVTGTNLNWVTSVDFYNKINIITVTDTFFVSTSATQLVIPVPLAAQTGQLIFHTAGVKPQTLLMEENLNIVLPAITDISPNPVERGGELTITGTDLDLVTGVLMNGVSDTIQSFISQTATEIVLTVPEEASYGPVTVYPYSLIPVVSADMLTFVGDILPLPPLSLAMYDNGYQNGFSYGWWLDTTPDPSNSEVVRVGCTASCKVTFNGDGGWSGAVFTNNGVSVSSYSTFEFSVYGGPGTDGQEIQISINGGSSVPFTVVEGKWTDFTLPLSDLDSPDTVTQVQFQDMGWSDGPEFVYFDRIGFN